MKRLRRFRRQGVALGLAAGLCGFVFAIRLLPSENAECPESAPRLDASPIAVDRGASGLSRVLRELQTRASILMVTAHPDDEDGGMLAYETRGQGARGILLSLNRGEGGQNAMSSDMYDALGLVRTQELLEADRYYGVDQYFANTIDYGFSKTREEALQKWGHDRVLADVVRVIRMTRPLVITSVFVGAPTDGHGNHQVAGQMAQEAFAAAGDPKRFPEQIKEGLRPWKPLKVYERTPFFSVTPKGMFDYATDKYVPVRFYDYIHHTWIDHKPPANIEISEGSYAPAAGLTFLQIARDGWGRQKTQNGGGTIPPPAPVQSAYHRYDSHVPAAQHEESFFDGIDVSVQGIASLATEDPQFLSDGLAKISDLAGEARAQYKADQPAAIAPMLAEGLKATRALIAELQASQVAEPGKSDAAFELCAKEQEFEQALAASLAVSFNATVEPPHPASGPFAHYGGPPPTFTIGVPGQAFGVGIRLMNSSPEKIAVDEVEVTPSDGKSWSIHAKGQALREVAPGKLGEMTFELKTPENASLTKPYFTRPNQEQPYYDLQDQRYRNLPLAPYPLSAQATLEYHGAKFTVHEVVQTVQRTPGIGLESQPLVVGPPVSVWVSPRAGAVPLETKSFSFSCTVHSNVKGPAKGKLQLKLPAGWTSKPAVADFSMSRDDEDQTIVFAVSPNGIKPGDYTITADAEYQGKTYEEGYRMVGYPGLRRYPYYRSATYRAVGVDVKTAPNLRIGFFSGTGDDVPQALANLDTSVRILSSNDLQDGNLSDYDAIILGVRAYAVRPELRTANQRLLDYVKNGGVLIVQYNLQNFGDGDGPYSFSLGSAQKVVDEDSAVEFLNPHSPVLTWPNRITAADFRNWVEERGHGFMKSWDARYEAPIETHDPEQAPQKGGLLIARYGKGIYVYDAFALYRQLPSGVPGAYRILANLVSLKKNPALERKTETAGQ
jgi:LmbE family N-acetylglucosaminyl deacetylase